MTKTWNCLIKAMIEITKPMMLIDLSELRVHACDNAQNTVMLNINNYIRKGKIILFLFIRVATALWGSLSTPLTKIMNILMIIRAIKNCDP